MGRNKAEWLPRETVSDNAAWLCADHGVTHLELVLTRDVAGITGP